jgi:hypothetical protein
LRRRPRPKLGCGAKERRRRRRRCNDTGMGEILFCRVSETPLLILLVCYENILLQRGIQAVKFCGKNDKWFGGDSGSENGNYTSTAGRG